MDTNKVYPDYLSVDCVNLDDPECLCSACLDYFENGFDGGKGSLEESLEEYCFYEDAECV